MIMIFCTKEPIASERGLRKMKLKIKVKLLIISLLLVFISGCNRISFVLYWADTLAVSSLNDYFDLTSSEEKKLKTEIRKLLGDIKSSEFLLITDLLKKIKNDLTSDSIDVTKIQNYENDFNKIIENISKKTKSIFVEQIQKQKLKGFKKFDEEFLNRIKQSLSRFEKSKIYDQDLKSLDRWVNNTLGFLTPDQQTWLKKEIKDNPSPQLLRIQSRQSVFETFKSSRNDETKLADFLNTYFESWESQQTSEYIQARDQYRAKLRIWIVKVLSEKNQNQKENLMKAIDKLIKELNANM